MRKKKKGFAPRLEASPQNIYQAQTELVALGAIHEVEERLSRFAAAYIFCDTPGRGFRPRCRCDVRCHGDLRVAPKDVIGRQRFNAEHIKRRMCDVVIKGCEQCVVVNQRATSGVEDKGTLGQQRQRRRIHDVGRGVGQGQQ